MSTSISNPSASVQPSSMTNSASMAMSSGMSMDNSNNNNNSAMPSPTTISASITATDSGSGTSPTDNSNGSSQMPQITQIPMTTGAGGVIQPVTISSNSVKNISFNKVVLVGLIITSYLRF